MVKSILRQKRWQRKASPMNVVAHILGVSEEWFWSAAWDWYNTDKASVEWDLTTIDLPYVSSGNSTSAVPID